MGDCGSDNAITFARFSAVISGVITSNLYVRDNDEKLFQAFQVLDKEKRGFLTPDELRGFLTTQGDVFSPEEMQEMLIVSTHSVCDGTCLVCDLQVELTVHGTIFRLVQTQRKTRYIMTTMWN
ncbi:hypothetical protein BSLG_008933 [Batrachochytrium salamandrivorans]|nr:hypothetical protein BSLG_008933 [Batrachochytrium salamandrivorans]